MNPAVVASYTLGAVLGVLGGLFYGCGSPCPERPKPAFTSYIVVDAADPSFIGGTVTVDAARYEDFQGEGFWLSYTVDGEQREIFWFSP